MNASISPYVMYPGNAGEPLAFYASILGGTPDTTPYTAFGYADGPLRRRVDGQRLAGPVSRIS